ncbi:hypothetical protein AHF37_00106 [Paragonimus kellicotti]|nr:hypothetical protein AHF37_00106 [Paragonimus kellicotti]
MSRFRPNQITGGGILKTTRLVDREIRSIYRLTVLARDGAAGIVTVNDHESHTRSANYHPASKRVTQLEHKVRTSAAQVWITVADVNDHHPVFVHPNSSHYQIPVSAHEEKNFILTRMVAIDRDNGANGNIRYKLLSQPSSDLFEIHGETGELFVKNRMDSSHLGTLMLTIEASDQGAPPQSNNVTLKIKIVDAPSTSQTKQTGQILSLIGLDDMGSDDADQTGTIEVNKLIIMCIIISTTVICFIMVLSIALFVRRNPCCRSFSLLQSQNHLSQTDQHNARWDESEEGEEKRLSKEGTDFKITSQISIILNMQIPVSAHEEKNFILTRMVAIDRDNGANGNIRYKLLSQPSSDLFEIHGETGELFVKNRMDSSHLVSCVSQVK